MFRLCYGLSNRLRRALRSQVCELDPPTTTLSVPPPRDPERVKPRQRHCFLAVTCQKFTDGPLNCQLKVRTLIQSTYCNSTRQISDKHITDSLGQQKGPANPKHVSQASSSYAVPIQKPWAMRWCHASTASGLGLAVVDVGHAD